VVIVPSFVSGGKNFRFLCLESNKIGTERLIKIEFTRIMQQNEVQTRNTLFPKLFIITVLIGVSWVASLFVFAVVVDRSERAEVAMDEIASAWSKAQTLNGPMLTIPVRVPTTLSTGERTSTEEYIYLLPHGLDYDIALEAQVRSRGIFDAAVYTSNVKGSGTFDLNELALSKISGTVLWDEATLSIGIPDTRGIDSEVALQWNTAQSMFEPGVTGTILGLSGIHAPIAVNQYVNENTFSFEFPLRGSREINFVPLGNTTTVRASSNWMSPNFSGQFLPKERELNDDGFVAEWSISTFGRSLSQSWTSVDLAVAQIVEEHIRNSTFGVALHQGVDFYTQVNRAIKYSILFISLTFLAFFMFEVLLKLRIHPMNYFLVGLAIALFYLFLLSLSESIGFLPAYVVSTIAITGLVTTYCRSVLKARRRASIIAVLLLGLYTYLYVLLQLDELSLIFGSVFLFVILATVMYLTRNIDWYKFSERA
jgi:inner membrane protein